MYIIVFAILIFFIYDIYKKINKIEKKVDNFNKSNLTTVTQSFTANTSHTTKNDDQIKTDQSITNNASQNDNQNQIQQNTLKQDQEQIHQHLQKEPQQVPIQQTSSSNILNDLNIPVKQTTTTYNKTIVDDFINWVKEDWLLKLGALLILIGISWIVTYSFVNNWIGPIQRIIFGILVGLLIFAFGVYRIKKYSYQGSIFVVLGSSTILLTIYAARAVYDFLTPTLALSIMFLTSLAVSYISSKFKQQNLSVFGLIMASIAPFLTASPTNNELLLLIYLLLIICSTIWVVVLNQKRLLIVISLVIVLFYSSFVNWGVKVKSIDITNLNTYNQITVQTSTPINQLVPIIFLITLILILANVYFVSKTKDSKQLKYDLYTSIGTTILILLWIFTAVREQLQPIVSLLWSIIFMFGTYYIYIKTKFKNASNVYFLSAVIMIVSATSYLLQDTTLTLILTFETLAIVLFIYKIFKDTNLAVKWSLLFLYPILSIPEVFFTSPSDSDFTYLTLVSIIMGLSILIAGMFLYSKARLDSSTKDNTNNIIKSLNIIGSLFVLRFISMFLLLLSQSEQVATTASLVIFTLIGLVMYFYALANNLNATKKYGAVILGILVLRLIIFDSAEMDVIQRIITFILVGVLLISTAFITKNPKIINSFKDKS